MDVAETPSIEEWVHVFRNKCSEHPEASTAIGAIRTLLEVISSSHATTLTGLLHSLQEVATALTKSTPSRITSVGSACELFLRFITLKASTVDALDEVKSRLSAAGEIFLNKALGGRDKIAPKGAAFIRDGATVLTLGRSRVVLSILLAAAQRNKRFSVLVAESSPSGFGKQMALELQSHSIPVTVIADAAVGYFMEKVDFVMVGAEAVVESGGIINTVGTYPTAIVAKAANKPFYVVAESFKFVRLYPLSQSDLPPQTAKPLPSLEDIELASLNPTMDYTPPSYITLLFTDLGVLTPSAVSDELIKLYL